MRYASVLFPAPAGPSMAITGLRGSLIQACSLKYFLDLHRAYEKACRRAFLPASRHV